MGRRVMLIVATMLAALLVASGAALAAKAISCKGGGARCVGTDGADEITGTNGKDIIIAGAGRDLIDARGGEDRVRAGGGGGYYG